MQEKTVSSAPWVEVPSGKREKAQYEVSLHLNWKMQLVYELTIPLLRIPQKKMIPIWFLRRRIENLIFQVTRMTSLRR